MIALSLPLDPALAEPPKYSELHIISEAILIRLLDPELNSFRSSELPDLFTQWWQAVVALDALTWEEKQYAAKALASFRSTYHTLPLMTARWLRYHSQHLLNRANRSPVVNQHALNSMDSPLLLELDCRSSDFTAWSLAT